MILRYILKDIIIVFQSDVIIIPPIWSVIMYVLDIDAGLTLCKHFYQILILFDSNEADFNMWSLKCPNYRRKLIKFTHKRCRGQTRVSTAHNALFFRWVGASRTRSSLSILAQSLSITTGMDRWTDGHSQNRWTEDLNLFFTYFRTQLEKAVSDLKDRRGLVVRCWGNM